MRKTRPWRPEERRLIEEAYHKDLPRIAKLLDRSYCQVKHAWVKWGKRTGHRVPRSAGAPSAVGGTDLADLPEIDRLILREFLVTTLLAWHQRDQLGIQSWGDAILRARDRVHRRHAGIED